MAKKSNSSREWLKEHFTDPYVKAAHKAGYRSRAVFKLKEIQERDRLFKPGMTVIDLGAAPGGWSQMVVDWVKPKGRVIAIDLLDIAPIPGVEFLQGDFAEEAGVNWLMSKIGSEKVDWVLSDMAPNMSGYESVDVPRALYLVELAVDFALPILKSQGGILVKVFQGDGFDALLKFIKSKFKTVVIRKPDASRGRSREIYLLARGLKAP